jgi:hypothetical protein
MEIGEIPVVGGPLERVRRFIKQAGEMGARAVGGAIEGALYDPAQLEATEFHTLVQWVPAREVQIIEARAEGERMMRIPEEIQTHALAAAQNYAEHYQRFVDRNNHEKREKYAIQLGCALLVAEAMVEDLEMPDVYAQMWKADLSSLVTHSVTPLPISDKLLPYALGQVD